MEIETWPIDKLVFYASNPRKNDHVVDNMAAFIEEYGFRVPVIAKSDGLVVDGHLRLKAAKKLGIKEIPVVLADDLSDTQIRGLRLAINKSAELASWDEDLVMKELEALSIEDFDIALTGFDLDGLKECPGISGGDEEPPEDKYQEQYGVIIMCESESDQEKIFNEMTEQGYNCRVVTT